MGKVFIIAIYSLRIPYNYDKYLIGTTGGDEWSKFEVIWLAFFEKT